MDPYAAMTEGVALVDRSETGKLALTGPEAKAFLDGQVSNEIEALEPGTGCYAALLADGAVEADEATADVLRVERGRPRYGVDLDDSVIPQEAGLNERAVSFTKGCYVGQETVARLHYRGKPNRHLRGLRLGEQV